MSALVKTLSSGISLGPAGLPRPNRRVLVLGAFAIAAAAVPGGLAAAGEALADAYLAVTVFVAATLAVLAAAQRGLRTDLGETLMRRPAWQVPAGALLGALPGCGGAIVAVTQFSRGSLSFGAMVATLTSTMGDAMFLLLARDPQSALLVAGVGVVAGIATGYAVDAIHGPRFLRRQAAARPAAMRGPWLGASMTASDWAWLALLAPGLVLGVLAAFQVAPEGVWVEMLGVTGAVLAVGLWALRGDAERPCTGESCDLDPARPVPQWRQVIDDTNFITAWVVFAFLGYELLVAATGVDVAGVFAVWAALVPAAAVALGLIPGCGPPIITTSLYLDGAIPLSALLGNALSNDGDALFPAIARAPRAAALATLYSALPALIVAYGAYTLGW